MKKPTCPVEETGELKAWARFDAAYGLVRSKKVREALSYEQLASVVTILMEAGYGYLAQGKKATYATRRRTARELAARVAVGSSTASDSGGDDAEAGGV